MMVSFVASVMKATTMKRANTSSVLRVHHFMILLKPNKEYMIRKKAFHRPTAAYMGRKSKW